MSRQPGRNISQAGGRGAPGTNRPGIHSSSRYGASSSSGYAAPATTVSVTSSAWGGSVISISARQAAKMGKTSTPVTRPPTSKPLVRRPPPSTTGAPRSASIAPPSASRGLPSAKITITTSKGTIPAKGKPSNKGKLPIKGKGTESVLKKFDRTVNEEMKRRRDPENVLVATITSDANLLEAVDHLERAEVAHSFAGALQAAEQAAASAETPELAEEAAVAGARDFETELIDVVDEDIPGVKPIQVIGYVGITRPTRAAR